jgi:hypothetical protein
MAERNQIVSVDNVDNAKRLEEMVEKSVRVCFVTGDDVLMISRQDSPSNSIPMRQPGQYMISCPNQLLRSLCGETVAEDQCTRSAIGKRKGKRHMR